MTETIEQKQDGPVRPDMTVGEIVQQFPDAVPIMLKFGLHCVGCHVSTWETLEQGAMGHGMPEDVFLKMLDEINSTLTTKPAADEGQKSVTITEAAAKKVIEMAQKDGRASAILRVRVIPGGCAGFRYDLDFADSAQADDIIIEVHGIKAIIDPASMDILSGSTVDYVNTLNASGFKIENPQSRKSCGCGESFG